MSLSIVHTRAALGVNAPPITIEKLKFDLLKDEASWHLRLADSF